MITMTMTIQEHVNTAVYRPDTPDHSLLWLWAIHNVANTNLAGDPTEVTKIQTSSSSVTFSYPNRTLWLPRSSGPLMKTAQDAG